MRAFNEARALCAGNVVHAAHMAQHRPAFNEARAFCAGNGAAEQPGGAQRYLPSMRPALCAREMAHANCPYHDDSDLQ